MRLVVDVGNSRLKWARLDDAGLAPGCQAPRSEPLEVLLDTHWAALPAPDGVLICSVAGADFDRRVEAWMAARWDCRPAWFQSERETAGIINGYDEPARLGSDRWAAMVGARAWCVGPVGVIDCGTAVTLDAVDADNRHLGGWIFPGSMLLQRSLMANTANIRDAAPDATASLGRSTAECVANGAWLGLAGGLERWMSAVESELANIAWLATGGDWPRLQPLIGRTVQHDPDLVLRGLARVLARSVLG